MKRRILVTGGCGFIGRHLCEALLNAGHDVTVLDNLSNSNRRHLPMNIELIVGDVCDSTLVTPLIAAADACYHLAAVSAVHQVKQDWLGSHRTNVLGMITLLNALAHTHAKQPIPFIYASSAAVYGNNPQRPLTETSTPQPLSIYGVDKFSCEMQASAAYREFGIPSIGLRLFNVYGPYQKSDSPYAGVITLLMKALSQQQPFTLYGDGEQTRDFIHVGDVIQFLLKCLTLPTTTATTMNICTGHTISLNQLITLLQEISGKKLQITKQPARTGDIQHSCGDANRAMNTLHYQANTSLREGLQKLFQHFTQTGTTYVS